MSESGRAAGPGGPASPHPPQAVPGMAVMGMAIALASLSVLFIAGMAGYLVVRVRAEAWPPPGMPRLPHGLWLSTAILIVSSGTIHAALRAARRDRQSALRFGMGATLALGLAFLVSQAVGWIGLVRAEMTVDSNLYAFTFFILTGLHGVHVLGGLIPLGIVTARAFRGRYGPGAHLGVRLCAMYWHFLDVVWLVMFVLMVVAA